MSAPKLEVVKRLFCCFDERHGLQEVVRTDYFNHNADIPIHRLTCGCNHTGAILDPLVEGDCLKDSTGELHKLTRQQSENIGDLVDRFMRL